MTFDGYVGNVRAGVGFHVSLKLTLTGGYRYEQMDIESVRRISLARYLYELGMSNLKTGNDLHLFAGVNLLQDAVEAFLVAVGDHVGASIEPRADFDKYFVKIDEKRAPSRLPFRLQLSRLNRIRVDSKHHGIQPAREECERLALSVRAFFEEVTTEVFGAAFSTVSALDLLIEGEVKAALIEAKTALEQKDYRTVAIACRKVVYLEIEHRYSIYRFRPGAPSGLLSDILMPVMAPIYARSLEYIDTHVNDPTDYIVLDDGQVTQELLSKGIEPDDFWNIWRLTPPMFRQPESREWVIREEFKKLDPDALVNEAEYLFGAAINVALGYQASRQRVRLSGFDRYTAALRHEEVSVYQKADRRSRVVGRTPKGQTTVSADYWVRGLTEDDFYWHVKVVTDDVYLVGFIQNDDVDVSREVDDQSA